ncbi:MAG: DUF6867 family protein [Rhodospirillaceae bacterium]
MAASLFDVLARFDVSLPVFFGLTIGLFGTCAFLAGQGAAGAWHGPGRVLLQCIVLAAADRFLVYGLFGGTLWSPAGFIGHGIVPVIIGLCSYRLTLARRMVTQYPWLYERDGPFGWRCRG